MRCRPARVERGSSRTHTTARARTSQRRAREPAGRDIAWSNDDWILFVVADDTNSCFKAHLDVIRPDGSDRHSVRILLFRICFDRPGTRGGVYVTDSPGTGRTFVTTGFGPDWNPTVN